MDAIPSDDDEPLQNAVPFYWKDYCSDAGARSVPKDVFYQTWKPGENKFQRLQLLRACDNSCDLPVLVRVMRVRHLWIEIHTEGLDAGVKRWVSFDDENLKPIDEPGCSTEGYRGCYPPTAFKGTWLTWIKKRLTAGVNQIAPPEIFPKTSAQPKPEKAAKLEIGMKLLAYDPRGNFTGILSVATIQSITPVQEKETKKIMLHLNFDGWPRNYDITEDCVTSRCLFSFEFAEAHKLPIYKPCKIEPCNKKSKKSLSKVHYSASIICFAVSTPRSPAPIYPKSLTQTPEGLFLKETKDIVPMETTEEMKAVPLAKQVKPSPPPPSTSAAAGQSADNALNGTGTSTQMDATTMEEIITFDAEPEADEEDDDIQIIPTEEVQQAAAKKSPITPRLPKFPPKTVDVASKPKPAAVPGVPAATASPATAPRRAPRLAEAKAAAIKAEASRATARTADYISPSRYVTRRGSETGIPIRHPPRRYKKRTMPPVPIVINAEQEENKKQQEIIKQKVVALLITADEDQKALAANSEAQKASTATNEAQKALTARLGEAKKAAAVSNNIQKTAANGNDSPMAIPVRNISQKITAVKRGHPGSNETGILSAQGSLPKIQKRQPIEIRPSTFPTFIPDNDPSHVRTLPNVLRRQSGAAGKSGLLQKYDNGIHYEQRTAPRMQYMQRQPIEGKTACFSGLSMLNMNGYSSPYSHVITTESLELSTPRRLNGPININGPYSTLMRSSSPVKQEQIDVEEPVIEVEYAMRLNNKKNPANGNKVIPPTFEPYHPERIPKIPPHANVKPQVYRTEDGIRYIYYATDEILTAKQFTGMKSIAVNAPYTERGWNAFIELCTDLVKMDALPFSPQLKINVENICVLFTNQGFKKYKFPMMYPIQRDLFIQIQRAPQNLTPDITIVIRKDEEDDYTLPCLLKEIPLLVTVVRVPVLRICDTRVTDYSLLIDRLPDCLKKRYVNQVLDRLGVQSKPIAEEMYKDVLKHGAKVLFTMQDVVQVHDAHRTNTTSFATESISDSPRAAQNFQNSGMQQRRQCNPEKNARIQDTVGSQESRGKRNSPERYPVRVIEREESSKSVSAHSAPTNHIITLIEADTKKKDEEEMLARIWVPPLAPVPGRTETVQIGNNSQANKRLISSAVGTPSPTSADIDQTGTDKRKRPSLNDVVGRLSATKTGVPPTKKVPPPIRTEPSYSRAVQPSTDREKEENNQQINGEAGWINSIKATLGKNVGLALNVDCFLAGVFSKEKLEKANNKFFKYKTFAEILQTALQSLANAVIDIEKFNAALAPRIVNTGKGVIIKVVQSSGLRVNHTIHISESSLENYLWFKEFLLDVCPNLVSHSFGSCTNCGPLFKEPLSSNGNVESPKTQYQQLEMRLKQSNEIEISPKEISRLYESRMKHPFGLIVATHGLTLRHLFHMSKKSAQIFLQITVDEATEFALLAEEICRGQMQRVQLPFNCDKLHLYH